MDKKFMNWSEYEAPSIKTLDILSEGVLCSSGALKINDWVNDDDESLNF